MQRGESICQGHNVEHRLNRSRSADHKQQLPTDRCFSGLKLHRLHAWKRYHLINSSASIPCVFAYSGPGVKCTGVGKKELAMGCGQEVSSVWQWGVWGFFAGSFW